MFGRDRNVDLTTILDIIIDKQIQTIERMDTIIRLLKDNRTIVKPIEPIRQPIMTIQKPMITDEQLKITNDKPVESIVDRNSVLEEYKIVLNNLHVQPRGSPEREQSLKRYRELKEILKGFKNSPPPPHR